MEFKMTNKLKHVRINSSKKFGKLQAFPIGKGRRRAISEIITTMLLLLVTIIGALMVSSFFTGTDITGAGSGISFTSITRTAAASVKITGYDTRDSIDLSGISVLDNVLKPTSPNLPDKLCTDSCKGSAANTLPAVSGGGTEFIVLTITNAGSNSVILTNVFINDVGHSWDSTKTGTLGTLNYPDAGKFSIISTDNSNLDQRTTNEVFASEEVRLVIKLSESISPDIKLGEALTVSIDTGSTELNEFVILSGDAR